MAFSKLARLSILGTALVGVLGVAAPGRAQTAPPAPGAATPPAPTPTAKPPTTSGETIIVTGSRIKHSTFNSPSPITVITAEDAELTGNVDTSHILQLTSVANNAVQINNEFSNYVVTGGPGVNTLSLRGIGAQRTLILIDGQRMGPAGVSGTVGPIDLNTIPASIIDHVDILNDGASSIYGSDAVAGVVNIITKDKLDGAEIHLYGNPTEHGGGDQYQMNAAIGKVFDRGYINAAFDVFQQDPLTYKQRPYLACSRDVAVDATTGASADVIDPKTGQAKCWNLEGPDVIDYGAPNPVGPAGAVFYAPNAAATLGGGLSGQDINGFQAVDIQPGNFLTTPTTAQIRQSAALFPYNPPQYGLGTALSPVSRYSFFLKGSYDLTPSNQVYGTLLLNQRDSSQVQSGQVFGIVDPGNPFNPGFGYPLPVVPYNIYTSQRVDYERLVLGVKGDLPSFGPLNNWTYDLYGQLSNSDGTYTQTYVKTDRINATMGAGAGTNGCDVNAIANPGSLSMAQAEPGVACVPVNYFAAVVNGGFTPAEQAFLFSEGVGHTNYKQYYLEGSTSGDVFDLPAGPLGASIGFHVRREDLDDTPGADFINANVYNYSTSGITKGSEEAQEVFGELEIPVIKNFPLIRRLNVNLSGRVSNYSDYGANETYKLGVDWDVTSWLTFRATQGTAFRAPALYEQYLANQTSYLGQLSIDPCINYGTSGASQNVQKNCASQGIPSNYAGNGSSAEIFQGGGKDLKPETSLDQTAGIVFQPKWFGLDLKIAATYFSFDIKNQIQNYGSANILYQCYNAPNFPNNPFCSLFTRDLNPSSSTYQQILTVNDDFVNVAEQFEQGMDLDVHYSTRLPKSIKFTLESHMSWSFFTSTDLLGGQTNNYLTQVGQPVFVGNVDFRFDRGPWTFNYYLDMVGHSSDDRFVSSYDTNYLSTGEDVFLNHVVPFYSTSDISLRRKFDKFTIEVGVKNLYDTAPPVYSSEGFQDRLGTVPLASQYDIIGRSYFVSLDAKF